MPFLVILGAFFALFAGLLSIGPISGIVIAGALWLGALIALVVAIIRFWTGSKI